MPRDQLDFQVEGTSLYRNLDGGKKPVKEMNVRILALFLGKTLELCLRWQHCHCWGPALSVAGSVGSASHSFCEQREVRGSFPVTPASKTLDFHSLFRSFRVDSNCWWSQA